MIEFITLLYARALVAEIYGRHRMKVARSAAAAAAIFLINIEKSFTHGTRCIPITFAFGKKR